jgi:hypothetical protein
MRLSFGENMTQIPKLKDGAVGIYIGVDENNEWIYTSLDPETLKQARENILKRRSEYDNDVPFYIYRVNGYFDYEPPETCGYSDGTLPE